MNILPTSRASRQLVSLLKECQDRGRKLNQNGECLERPGYTLIFPCITGTFTTETMNVCLHEQNVYCIEAMKVQVRTHQVKTIPFKYIIT